MTKRHKNPSKAFPDVVHDVRCNIAKFESKITKTAGCWTWSGPRHRQGYGMFAACRVSDNEVLMVTAHRLAYRIYVGAITQPNVIHTCMNLDCTNPAHLILGTQADVGQMNSLLQRTPMRKGVPRGPYNHQQHGRTYTYSLDDIQWVRQASYDEIAQRYAIPRDRAVRMRHGFRYNYKWLPCDRSQWINRRGRPKKTNTQVLL